MTHINIIAALQKKDRALGKGNDLLWKISDDLKHFKSLTLTHPIIMGRKTYDSIGKPLPQRANLIITRQSDFVAEGCTIVNSLEQALEKAKEIDQKEIFIIGGAEVFAQSLRFADRLYLTIVDDNQEGDVFFPDYSEFKTVVKEEPHLDETPPYTFIELTR
ncbi:MAG: dihydrofolate reductase [bacterium]|nr:dihydrofolate reductase [bacterium]